MLVYFVVYALHYLNTGSFVGKMLKSKKKKFPWIPPPGRTFQHLSKISPKTHSERVPATPSMYVTATDAKHLDDDTFDLVSLCSLSSTTTGQKDKAVHLRSIKEEIKLFAVHFKSLKRVSLFLNRYFIVHETENPTIKDLNAKIDDTIKDILFELDDLEYSVSLVENTIDEQSKSEEYLKVVKNKEKVISKLLNCYSNAVTIFEAVIQMHNAEDADRVHRQQEVLQKLQNCEKKCTSQTAMIKDFQRKLSILQGRNTTVESYKSSLEDKRKELQKQLSYKEAQVKYLCEEVAKLNSKQPKLEDNEELIVIIEKIKKISEAEKTALKKALKVQKSRTENAKETIEKLSRDLKEREKVMFNLASQRDQLKVQLTKESNSSIERKTRKQDLKIKNTKLQEELSFYKTHLKELEICLEEKTTMLNQVEKDKKSLEEELAKCKSAVMISKDLQSLDTNADPLVHCHGDGKEEIAVNEMKNLIALLKDTKEYFTSVKTTSMYTSAIEDQNAFNANVADSANKNVLNAVDEVKVHLLDLKKLCDSSKMPSENLELGKKFNDLQEAYDFSCKQNELLKKEIKQLKNSKSANAQVSPSENISTYSPETEYAAKSLQLELKLKSDENWRIKQREKDLERQLEEVKDKLQRKEIENIRLFSIEEELKVKKSELSLLELKKEEETEKFRRRLGDLQDSFDKLTAEHEGLKRYVQVLKCSYSNVFGGAGY